MKKRLYLVGIVLCTAMLLVACGKEKPANEDETLVQQEQQEQQEPEIDPFLTDNNYDPSVEKYIGRARIFAEGYELNFGSEPRKLGNNTTMFIGDSFFDYKEFWTDFYSNYYSDKDVLLAGIGGTTTSDWSHLWETVFYGFKDTQPKNIVVHLGCNDLWSSDTRPDDVTDRLKYLFNTFHERFPDTKIYYFGITHRGDNSAQDRIDIINSDMSGWCAENNGFMTYIDTPSKIKASDLMGDKLHPLLSTYRIFVEELEKAGCVIADQVEE